MAQETDDDGDGNFPAVPLDRLEAGTPVLFDSGTAREHDLPGLNLPEGAEHMGFGAFIKEEADGDRSYTFDGGGAMRHAGDVSWTPVKGDREYFIEDTGYDIDTVTERVRVLVEGADGA